MKLLEKLNAPLKENVTGILLGVLFFSSLLLFCYSFHYSPLIPLLVFFLGIYLYFAHKASYKLQWNLGILLVLIIILAHIIIQYSTWPRYIIPVAGIAMLTMLLFKDVRMSFVMAFVSSAIVALMIKGDISILVTFFIGSLTGALTVKGARTRGHLINAVLFVSVIQIACFFISDLDRSGIFVHSIAANPVYQLILNAVLSIVLVGSTLTMFEHLFGVLTNFSLLELSDFNHPLLKRMVLEAPGTYHHSLMVSNLAEAGADAIGADALLTRVGAYYHDIGKMVKSEYFTENQIVGANVHDRIEPSMSRLVIQNHVKEGIELAKKYNLNPLIVDFIPQHHGTSLMYFFYQKALEEAEEGEVVKEEDYRYPGPKPQTRETAITLLADSVEGATRALDDPNPTNIEETVKKVINNKFIDGQLDECPLTLKEIDRITKTFVRILSAMHHGRVKYPEKKNGKQKTQNGSSRKQSSDNPKNQPPPGPDARPDSS